MPEISKNNRKYNGLQKYLGICLGILFGAVLAAGCGRGGGGPAEDPDRVVYLAEFQDMDFGEGAGGQIKVQEQDGSIYMILDSYIEETQEYVTQMIKMDAAAGSQEVIPLFEMRENETVSGFSRNEKGNFVLLSTVWQENQTQYFLCEVSTDGKKLNEKEITDLFPEGQYVMNMTGDGQGNFYLATGGMSGGYTILALDSKGVVKSSVDIQDYIYSLFCAADGTVYTTGWGANGMAVKKVDMEGGTVGGEVALTGVSTMGSMTLAAGGPTGVLLSDSTGLYTCDLETGQCDKILDWLESNVNANNIQNFGTAGEDTFWALNQIWGQGSTSTELVILNPTTVGELPRKEILTYGALYLGTEAKSAIIDFNKNNSKYRIQATEYMGGDWNNWEEGLNQMNLEIASNNCPDIIDLAGGMDIGQAINKGIIADLYPYMDRDETFHREDYQENILSIYETDSKLYGLMPRFIIHTLAGSADKLQGIDKWSIDELFAFSEKYPEAQLFDATADSVMFIFMSTNMDQFVDWSAGTCSFDKEEFIRILEYANTFGTEYTDWNDPERIGTHEGIQTGKYLMLDHVIYNLDSIQILKGMFDGPVKIPGYPTVEGNGIAVQPIIGLSMSAKSKEKDGVWEFMSWILSDDYQNQNKNSGNGLPLKKTAIDMLCDKAQEERYITDEDGNRVKTAHYTTGYDDLILDIYAATDEDINLFHDMLDRADCMYSNDSQMYNIINEEVQSYFAGQKSTAEVVEIIQNRVQIYMNEQR